MPARGLDEINSVPSFVPCKVRFAVCSTLKQYFQSPWDSAETRYGLASNSTVDGAPDFAAAAMVCRMAAESSVTPSSFAP